MRKSKKDTKNKSNIRLGVYFLAAVVFIIIVSFSIKVFDSIKSSKFDSGNHFTVAILNNESTEFITVSPQEGEVKKLTVDGINTEKKLNNLGVPYDSLARSKNEISGDARNYFSKFIGRGIENDLSIIDIIKLNLATRTISGDKVEEASVSVNDDELENIKPVWFVDPEIEKEGLKIEITNSTEVSGLGRAYADLVTNMGGNVVLVNSAQEEIEKSVIYYSNDSYSVDKLSKLLDIPKENKELNSVSDIIIVIGKDLTAQ